MGIDSAFGVRFSGQLVDGSTSGTVPGDLSFPSLDPPPVSAPFHRVGSSRYQGLGSTAACRRSCTPGTVGENPEN